MSGESSCGDVPKSAVLKAGGYKHFPLFEDYYLWVRMLMDGARFYNIQESLLFFRFSPDMFKRRGGWRYAVTEVKLQTLFYRIGFIDFFSLIRNICIRLVTRLLPMTFALYFIRDLYEIKLFFRFISYIRTVISQSFFVLEIPW